MLSTQKQNKQYDQLARRNPAQKKNKTNESTEVPADSSLYHKPAALEKR